jgi:hypothetical protein
VGLDGQLLVACAAATTGLCWLTVPTTLPATPTVAGIVLGCTNATNAALGCNALRLNSGTGNIAVGLNSMCANTTGINNVAVGNTAFDANTVGSGNVAIGTGALGSAVDVSRVVAIGEGALSAQTTGGQYNVALGWSALCSATGTAGGSNVALGALAGNNITTGSSNVIIGPNVTVPFGNQDNQLAIGYNTGQCWLTGDSSKNVKFWAGIRDYTNSLGTNGQVLTSNGTVAQWANAGGAKQYFYALVGQTGVNINSGNTIPIGAIAFSGISPIFNNAVLTVGKTYLLTVSLLVTARNNSPIARWIVAGAQVGPEVYLEGTYINNSSSWIYTPTTGANNGVQLQLGQGNVTFRSEASSLTIVEI